MEPVRLELVGGVPMSSAAVAQFVQSLKDVPADAACEIEEIRCRQLRGGAQTELTESVVRMLCDPRVAVFLCKRFAQQTRQIARGELLLVRCRRIHDPSTPSHVSSVRIPLNGGKNEKLASSSGVVVKQCSDSNALPPPALPMDKVVALIDVLGDQVADAHDAYELFALRDASPPHRMSLLGLSKAVVRLCKDEWLVKQATLPSQRQNLQRSQQQQGEDGIPPFATVSSLRTLLTRLMAVNGVAMTSLPASLSTPCVSYTDFLACYVALLHSIHSSTLCA